MGNHARNTVRIVIGVIAILAVAFVIILLLGSPKSSGSDWSQPVGSSFSTAPHGDRILYDLFGKLGFAVQRYHRPFGDRFLNGGDFDIIWHTRTKVEVGEDEVSWIENWVKNGGTLVLVNSPDAEALLTSDYSAIFQDRLLNYWLDKLKWQENVPEVNRIGHQTDLMVTSHRMPVKADRLANNYLKVDTLQTYIGSEYIAPVVYRYTREGTEDGDIVMLLRDLYGIVAAEYKYGNGSVRLISDPFIFGNLLIREADNSLFAVEIVSGTRGGEYPRILFDEYHLGYYQTRTLIDAARTPLGRAIIYLGIVTALAVGTAGAGFGIARSGSRTIGVSQRAFVRALAGLWLAAGATSAVADSLRRRYNRGLKSKTKWPNSALEGMRKEKPRVEELLEIARNID